MYIKEKDIYTHSFIENKKVVVQSYKIKNAGQTTILSAFMTYDQNSYNVVHSSTERENMTFEQIEELVRKGKSISKYAGLTDRKCYLALQHLYLLFRLQAIDKQSAAREKHAIRHDYFAEYGKENEMQEFYRQRQENVMKVELLLTKIAKAKSKDVMLDGALKCIGILTRDELTFYQLMKKKAEGLSDGAECVGVSGENHLD